MSKGNRVTEAHRDAFQRAMNEPIVSKGNLFLGIILWLIILIPLHGVVIWGFKSLTIGGVVLGAIVLIMNLCMLPFFCGYPLRPSSPNEDQAQPKGGWDGGDPDGS